MQGAREYSELFSTGQIDRLYIVSGYHARGKTFRIYVLPEDEKAIPNSRFNPPLNKDAVEVYGIIGGQPGWTETYGWLHEGKWQEDFQLLATQRLFEKKEHEAIHALEKEEKKQQAELRKKQLLESY